MDFDGSGDPYILKIVDNSYHHSKHMMAPASIALRQASTCFSKLADAFVLFFSRFPHSLLYATSGSSFGLGIHTNPSTQRFCSKATPSCFSFPHDSFNALFSHKFPSFFLDFFFRPAAGNVLPLPLLSLAASLIPPLGHFTPSVFAIPPEDDKSPCNAHHRGCVSHALPAFNWPRHAVEPKTGIQFPQALNSIMAKDNQSNLSSEVLVGIGSRIMTIIRIKSLKVYAFGFYVHPSSLCQKLGSKYGSVPVAELKERDDFYADLLREDIGMTVRLVVNYNGMKINTVKDAFEKSLRTRLAKTNPETDFKCISTFGSYFTKDIPLPVGTIIDIRRTADGQLITEIGGNQIGAVHSRELCRAFFDMYLGEVPVSEQTKEEIGRNVATIIRRC